MSTLVPSASSCYGLRLPPTEKDDRLNLNVRTGSASTLYKSLVFTYGGLTIGLDIGDESVDELIRIFHLKISNLKSNLIDKYLSGEFFYLDLIEKYWTRVDIPSGERKPKPRVFHEITAVNNCIYVFGGLIVNEKYDSHTHEDTNERELVPCNDLWEFSLESRKWNLLHDGSKYEYDAAVPRPRFSHKMTTLSSLSFANRKDHFGIFIAGGRDDESRPLYDNFVFDLVTKEYVGSSPIELTLDTKKNSQKFRNVNSIVTSEDYKISVDYVNNVIISFIKEPTHHHHHSRTRSTNKAILSDYTSTMEGDESLIVYSQVDSSKDQSINTLLSFKVGKSIKEGKILPVHNKVLTKENETKRITNHTIPYNLKFPTGGLFGQNIVITGFLPNDNDICVFIYNKPTGKWSRLNFFCDHDYGSHRCWGGFAWQSHHKVVLLGNYLTSRTTSSIRYFTLMITVSLPITNILASLELEGGHYHCPDGTKVFYKDDNSSTDDNNRDRISEEDAYSSSDALSDGEKKMLKRHHSVSASSDKAPQSISFSEYVHYVAPKTKFTTIRSVFPPAAITLGRNAMDRYGDLISDFELVSSKGDRIPVSLRILMERWGRYFVQLLAKGYVQAVDRFERDQQLDSESTRNASSASESMNSANKTQNKLRSSMSTCGGSSISSSNSEVSINQSKPSKKGHHQSSYHVSIPAPSKYSKEPPQFRLPFQELSLTNNSVSEKANETINQHFEETKRGIETNNNEKLPDLPGSSHIKDEQPDTSRKGSVSSFSSSNSLLNSHLQNIPPQLPLPNEPIPAVPASTSFRGSSRKNSADLNSPRASLMYTLTALRNIPATKSPRESPFSSPRASVSGGPAPMGNELLSLAIPNLKQSSLSTDRNNHRLTRSLDSSPNGSTDALPIKTAAGECITDQNFRNKKVSNSSSMASLETFNLDKKFSPLSSIQPNTNKIYAKDADDRQDYEETNTTEANNSLFSNPLLDFENAESGKFRMEPSLIPRKLYMPFATSSIKAFCEYLYTGQVGNKWLLSPVTLDNLAISKFLDVPLLYDLISEVLFGVIGRKESFIIREGNKLKRRYHELLELTGSVKESGFKFPLDEYEGFMDTIDDGFLDITLLKKSSASHKDSSASAMSSKRNKLSLNSASSFRYSISIDDINENAMSLREVPIDETLRSTNTESNQENIPTNNQEESTDDSIEKSTSNSEEDTDFELGYLDARDNLSLNVGPRAKSIFDKSGTDMQFHSALDNDQKEKESEMEKSKSLNLTLEQLVSPQSPLPSDYTIDLIYETATLCRDIKLMLRAANVKNMGDVFNQSKLELNIAIEELENKYDEQQKQQDEEQKIEHPQFKGKIPSQPSGNESDTGLEHIRSNMSSSSLSTLGLRSVDLEKTKSNTGFRAIGGFGPFKSKTDLKALKMTSFENNKELDRRITRLIKNDEKLKLKTAKDEKLKRLQDQKLERRQTDKPKLMTRKSIFTKYKDEGSTSTLASEASTNKKKHGFLHHLSHKKKNEAPINQGDNSLLESSNLSRTLSASGSISSANSKKSQGLRIKNSLFGKKRLSN